MSENSYIETRIAQLEKSIQENLAILEEYERQRSRAKDPREQRDIEDQIKDTKRLLDQAREEMAELESRASLRQPAPPSKKPKGAVKTDSKRPSSSVPKSQPEMKDIPDPVPSNNGTDGQAEVVAGIIAQGQIDPAELQETLNSVIRLLEALDQKQSALTVELREKLSEAKSAVKSEMSLQRKLEYTLPIVPMFLNYKIELGVENSLDLKDVWDDLQKRWNAFVSRADKNIWTLATIRAYGQMQQNGDNSTEDVVVLAHKSFSASLKALQEKRQYLFTLEAKLDHSAANINILINARKEGEALSELSQEMLNKIQALQISTGITGLFPSAELKRIIELTESLINSVHSAAGLLAGHQNASQSINQVKRNMPILARMIDKVVLWLEQMEAVTIV